ncbi:MAG TPA: hypothetical protein VF666_02460 [Pyrinomonadaceae bacterium]|jgi:hypothetical protein
MKKFYSLKELLTLAVWLGSDGRAGERETDFSVRQGSDLLPSSD